MWDLFESLKEKGMSTSRRVHSAFSISSNSRCACASRVSCADVKRAASRSLVCFPNMSASLPPSAPLVYRPSGKVCEFHRNISWEVFISQKYFCSMERKSTHAFAPRRQHMLSENCCYSHSYHGSQNHYGSRSQPALGQVGRGMLNGK